MCSGFGWCNSEQVLACFEYLRICLKSTKQQFTSKGVDFFFMLDVVVMKYCVCRLEVTKLGLTLGKPVRQDVNFWKKAGNEILLSIQENCELQNNTLPNIEAMYATLMLLLAEIRSDDVIVDILRVLFHVQVCCFCPLTVLRTHLS